MQNLKKLRWSILSSVALIGLTLSFGFTPIVAVGAPTPKLPTMSVVPAFSSINVGEGTDFTVYVQVPDNPPTSGGLRNLLASFIVQSISNSITYPNGTVVDQGTIVTCTTAATNKEPAYPSRNAETICNGFYEQRVIPRAYSGSNTAIFFLGLVGFNPAGTYTVTFVVSGLYYGSTIMLTASAKLVSGSTTSGSAAKSSGQPTLSVVPGLSSIPANGTDDFYLYVQVPNNPPVSGTFYNLLPAFVLQSITESDTLNGSSGTPTTFLNCQTKAGGGYPGYPSRNAQTTCKGVIYYQRVEPRAYWGANTGIWFLGFGFGGTPGTFTTTFTVTGLYYGNTITLTASASVTLS